MNTYEEMKNRQQKEFDAFPMGAAFSNKQFEEMMQKWGLTINDTDKICSIGGGCYIRKTDIESFLALINKTAAELKNAIKFPPKNVFHVVILISYTSKVSLGFTTVRCFFVYRSMSKTFLGSASAVYW